MKNNETGEFELVVGNRQLLSGFAIVVLLFGVGVAMGYILGQNSPRSAKLQPEGAVTSSVPDSRPQPASPAAQPVAAPVAAPPAAGDAPAGAPPDSQQPATQPARDPAGAPPAAQPAGGEAASSLPEAPPGNYWQVMALPQKD